MTKQEQAIRWLLEKGCVRDNHQTSRKYVKLINPANAGKVYWIGKMGAVRVGPCVSKSISITGIIEHAIRREGSNRKAE